MNGRHIRIFSHKTYRKAKFVHNITMHIVPTITIIQSFTVSECWKKGGKREGAREKQNGYFRHFWAKRIYHHWLNIISGDVIIWLLWDWIWIEGEYRKWSRPHQLCDQDDFGYLYCFSLLLIRWWCYFLLLFFYSSFLDAAERARMPVCVRLGVSSHTWSLSRNIICFMIFLAFLKTGFSIGHAHCCCSCCFFATSLWLSIYILYIFIEAITMHGWHHLLNARYQVYIYALLTYLSSLSNADDWKTFVEWVFALY